MFSPYVISYGPASPLLLAYRVVSTQPDPVTIFIVPSPNPTCSCSIYPMCSCPSPPPPRSLSYRTRNLTFFCITCLLVCCLPEYPSLVIGSRTKHDMPHRYPVQILRIMPLQRKTKCCATRNVFFFFLSLTRHSLQRLLPYILCATFLRGKKNEK